MSFEINQVPTGIEELDRILNGGLPRGSITLIAGGPGKTLTALQFLYNGAVKFSERGVLIIFNENAQTLKQFTKTMRWDFDRLKEENMIKILDFIVVERSSLESMLDMIFERVLAFSPQRLVIDSLTALTMSLERKR